MTQAEVYKPSCREYKGLPELEYPFHELEKRITVQGDIILSRKIRVFVSTILAGQLVGLTEVDDGIWKVTFMDYDIGCFDEESCKFTPLDNPLEKLSRCVRYKVVKDVSGCTYLGETTKTDASVRVLLLSDELVEVLRVMKMESKSHAKKPK